MKRARPASSAENPAIVTDRQGVVWERDGSGTYTKPTFFGSWGRGMRLDELDLERKAA